MICRVCYLPNKKSSFFLEADTRHHIPFSLHTFFCMPIKSPKRFWVLGKKLLKPAGSHCGVDGDADGWPDEDLSCSRDASFPIKETIYRNTFQLFSR